MGTNQNNLTSPEYPHCNCVTQTSQTGKKKWRQSRRVATNLNWGYCSYIATMRPPGSTRLQTCCGTFVSSEINQLILRWDHTSRNACQHSNPQVLNSHYLNITSRYKSDTFFFFLLLQNSKWVLCGCSHIYMSRHYTNNYYIITT